MFEGYIRKDPTAEYDAGLDYSQEVRLQVQLRYVEMGACHHLRKDAREDERQAQKQAADEDTKGQYVHHSMVPQRNLLTDVISTQTER